MIRFRRKLTPFQYCSFHHLFVFQRKRKDSTGEHEDTAMMTDGPDSIRSPTSSGISTASSGATSTGSGSSGGSSGGGGGESLHVIHHHHRRAATMHHVRGGEQPPVSKPVLRKHGKLISFFRSFILNRPNRGKLKKSGILKERVFGCDLSEHLLNTGQPGKARQLY